MMHGMSRHITRRRSVKKASHGVSHKGKPGMHAKARSGSTHISAFANRDAWKNKGEAKGGGGQRIR